MATERSIVVVNPEDYEDENAYEIAKFLSEFVQEVTRNGIKLCRGGWFTGDPSNPGEFCVLGQFLKVTDRDIVENESHEDLTKIAARRLGCRPVTVKGIIHGWDRSVDDEIHGPEYFDGYKIGSNVRDLYVSLSKHSIDSSGGAID